MKIKTILYCLCLFSFNLFAGGSGGTVPVEIEAPLELFSHLKTTLESKQHRELERQPLSPRFRSQPASFSAPAMTINKSDNIKEDVAVIVNTEKGNEVFFYEVVHISEDEIILVNEDDEVTIYPSSFESNYNTSVYEHHGQMIVEIDM